jgi:hypothetical protein
MAPLQRKFGLAAVVEANLFPGFRYVTGAALATEYTQVSILAQVAGHAFGGCALECLIDVTSRTGRVRMPALQRKIGARMIECPGLPGCFRVACRAVFTELSIMHVVVTTGTGPVRIPEFGVVFVALVAKESLVGAKQLEIGPIVIEMIGVHSRYVLLTTLVVSMATATVERPGGSHTAVKAALAVDVRGDFFMAIHT